MTTRKDIEQVLWNACDSFRGKIDSSRYKDYAKSSLARSFRKPTRYFKNMGYQCLYCVSETWRPDGVLV